jgi:hypothetical protein
LAKPAYVAVLPAMLISYGTLEARTPVSQTMLRPFSRQWSWRRRKNKNKIKNRSWRKKQKKRCDECLSREVTGPKESQGACGGVMNASCKLEPFFIKTGSNSNL